MEIMKNYSDLITEIECIKQEIQLTKREFEYWSGIDLDDPSKGNIMLNGTGSYKHGTETALIQMDKKRKALNRLYERLEYHEQTKGRLESLFEQFKGIEYQVAYKRWVEIKGLQQVADELGYSHQYIKEISAKLSKTYQKPTDLLKKA